MSADTEKSLAGRKIGVLGKGGAGKSTAVVLLARALVRSGQLPATRHLEDPDLVALANRLFQEARLQEALFVLSRIPNERTESFVRRKLAAHGIEPIGTLYEDPTIAEAWLTGSSLPFPPTGSDVEAIIGELEQVASASGVTS